MAASLLMRARNVGAVSYTFFYRLRGATDPWINAGTVAATPAPAEYTETSVIGVPANEYEFYSVANCADGLTSVNSPIFYSTPTCAAPLALSVTQDADNFIVSYNLPSSVAIFNLQVSYPNGGNFNANISKDPSGQYILAKPANVYGDYTFQIRSVCNPNSGWYSGFTNQVLVTVNNPAICPAVEITGQARVATSASTETWRFTLGQYTSQVRVIITNNTTGAPQTVLTQTVTTNYVDVPLPVGEVNFNYTINIFNLCEDGTDNIGDTTSVVVQANTMPVSTAGWTITAVPDTLDVNGDSVIGTRVTLSAPAPPSGTNDVEATVRFNCSTAGYAYVSVIIPAGQTSGVTRDWNSGCTIDLNSGFINSAVLI